MNLVSVGKAIHKRFGSVDDFLDKDTALHFYMVHQCPACGCNNVLVKNNKSDMCIDCANLRTEFNMRMKSIQRYNDYHVHLASDEQYEKFEEIVNEYQRRRDAGLYVPDKFDQAVYMIEYWRRNKNGV